MSSSKAIQFKATTILRGIETVPEVATSATGHLLVKASTEKVEYILEGVRIVNITGVSLSLGIRGQKGPSIVSLMNPHKAPLDPDGGIIVQGYFDETGLEGCLKDMPLDFLLKEISRGHVYVNVTTVKNPQGEIRGQLEWIDDPDFQWTTTTEKVLENSSSDSDPDMEKFKQKLMAATSMDGFDSRGGGPRQSSGFDRSEPKQSDDLDFTDFKRSLFGNDDPNDISFDFDRRPRPQPGYQQRPAQYREQEPERRHSHKKHSHKKHRK